MSVCVTVCLFVLAFGPDYYYYYYYYYYSYYYYYYYY
jgi:hypothetical protein